MVYNVEFSPDGKYIATVSGNTACIWDTGTGKQIFALNHDDQVNNVEFSPDGKYIATASNDKTVKLWTERLWVCSTEDMINESRNCFTRNLMSEEWKEYMGDEPYHKTFPNLQ